MPMCRYATLPCLPIYHDFLVHSVPPIGEETTVINQSNAISGNVHQSEAQVTSALPTTDGSLQNSGSDSEKSDKETKRGIVHRAAYLSKLREI